MNYGVKEGSYIEYVSNNSGGNWWLTDKDWEALEEAGWVVRWLKDDEHFSSKVDENGRWLRTKAMRAKRYGLSMGMAMAEFAMLTGQDLGDTGCSCCGEPHSFYAYDENEEMIW